MTKFVSNVQVVNAWYDKYCDTDIEGFVTALNGDIIIKDDEGIKHIIDEDTLCQIYGDDAAGGAHWVEGGAELFGTISDREVWENQK